MVAVGQYPAWEQEHYGSTGMLLFWGGPFFGKFIFLSCFLFDFYAMVILFM